MATVKKMVNWCGGDDGRKRNYGDWFLNPLNIKYGPNIGIFKWAESCRLAHLNPSRLKIKSEYPNRYI